jgi:hypothetical protein
MPQRKLPPVENSTQFIAAAAPTKDIEKTTSDVIDLSKDNVGQPFCDPPIKSDDIDPKHTFKETEQDIAILPSDLNRNVPLTLKQLCDYYTRLSKKNLTSKKSD